MTKEFKEQITEYIESSENSLSKIIDLMLISYTSSDIFKKLDMDDIICDGVIEDNDLIEYIDYNNCQDKVIDTVLSEVDIAYHLAIKEPIFAKSVLEELRYYEKHGRI